MADAHAAGAGGRAGLSQAHWGLVSQGLNTGTNFLLSILVARSVSAAEFGQLSLALIVYILAMGTVRTVGNNVLTVRYTTSAELPTKARQNLGFAVGWGLLVGAGCVAAGLFTTGPIRPALLVLGVGMPFVLGQEAVRGFAFARARPAAAAGTDGVWAGVQVAASGLLLLGVDAPPMWALVACWAGSGAVACVAGLFAARMPPAVHLPHHWPMTHLITAAPLYGSYLLAALPLYVTFLLMPAVTDLGQVGVLRAAYLFFGPLGTLFAGIHGLALVDAVRAGTGGRRLLLGARVSAILLAVAAAWGVVVVFLPDGVGRLVVGASWEGTFDLRLLLAVTLCAEGSLVGALVGLASMQLARRATVVQIVLAPATLALAIGLAGPFGAAGVAGGLAAGYWLIAVVVWSRLPRAARAAT